MVFLFNVSLAYEKVRQINPWISEDILSFMCPQDSNVAGQRRLDSSVQGVMGNFYFSVSCLQTSRETHLRCNQHGRH